MRRWTDVTGTQVDLISETCQQINLMMMILTDQQEPAENMRNDPLNDS